MDKKKECPDTEIKCDMPCGKLSHGRCCGNCKFGTYEDGRVYCGIHKHYYPSSDYCNDWEEG